MVNNTLTPEKIKAVVEEWLAATRNLQSVEAAKVLETASVNIETLFTLSANLRDFAYNVQQETFWFRRGISTSRKRIPKSSLIIREHQQPLKK